MSLAVLRFAVLASLIGVGISPAEQITVRLIQVKSGKAAEGVPVMLNPGPPRAGVLRLESTTSNDGRATFQVSPLPEEVFVSTYTGKVYGCTRRDEFRTVEILEHGITVENTCGRQPPEEIKAKPGEILIFVRPLTLLERMQR